jgi:hypothetical protein
LAVSPGNVPLWLMVAKLEEEIGKLKQPGEERWELRRE